MKNRRIAIIAFVLVAVMAIGVGYAAMTDNFMVDGSTKATANTVEFNEEVTITSASITAQSVAGVDHTNTCVIDTTSADYANDKVTITVPETAFVTNGDYVEATIVISNASELAVTLANVDITSKGNTNTTDFRITYTGIENGKTIAAVDENDVAGTYTIKVRIELITTPSTEVQTSFEVKFDVVSA